MKGIKSMLATLLLTGLVGFSAVPVGAQEGVLFKAKFGNTNYCHMRFPAIREDTLSRDRPVLKAKGTGDIIDFYGPCDYNPTGKEAVWRQHLQYQRAQNRARN